MRAPNPRSFFMPDRSTRQGKERKSTIVKRITVNVHRLIQRRITARRIEVGRTVASPYLRSLGNIFPKGKPS